ncbi:hypothetical protein Tco_1389057 [Tanacetum coccineum]
MGLSATQIADVMSADLRILTRLSIHSIERSVTLLKKLLGDQLFSGNLANGTPILQPQPLVDTLNMTILNGLPGLADGGI